MPDYVTAAKLVLQRLKAKRDSGRLPKVLGTCGMLALMFDKISRWNDEENTDELRDLAADALAAFTWSIDGLMKEAAKEAREGLIHCPKCGRSDVPVSKAYLTSEVEICHDCGTETTWEDYQEWLKSLEK